VGKAGAYPRVEPLKGVIKLIANIWTNIACLSPPSESNIYECAASGATLR